MPAVKKSKVTIDIDLDDLPPVNSRSRSSSARWLRQVRQNAEKAASTHITVSRNKHGRLIQTSSFLRRASTIDENKWFKTPIDADGKAIYVEKDLSNAPDSMELSIQDPERSWKQKVTYSQLRLPFLLFITCRRSLL
jgi:hypothetical protein